jgi:hypothetical protein
MSDDPEAIAREFNGPAEPAPKTPMDRAQARIALHWAECKLMGRRDLRAEIRYTLIASRFVNTQLMIAS